MMTLLAVLSLLSWLWLMFLHGRFWQAGPALGEIVSADTPPVSIVVPARDEAALIGRSIGSLLAQNYRGALRVVLVDDGSNDGTGDIARALADPRLTVVSGGARPTGWAGKLWAVHQGIATAQDQAADPFLLLTDADIVHEPGHVATLVAQAERTGVDMVSEMVALNCTSGPEKALVPAFVYFFQLLYPFARVNDGLRATAAAAGGTVLIRARALARIGGIAAIKGALIDDVALAIAVKRGGRIWLGHSTLARSIRPYPDVADIWRMVTRSAYVQLRYSPSLLVLTTLGLGLVFLIPPLAVVFSHHAARWIGLLTWVLMATSFVPSLRRFRLSVPVILLAAAGLPLIAVFYMTATIAAAVAHHRGHGVVWKQRAYSERGA
jgi:hopene-associated glycosyltransferase HpnB